MDQIEIVNLIPKFLAFYDAANDSTIDEEQRYLLWEKHYNFAALPPGEERSSQARSLLNEAWEKYHDRIEFIKEWKADLKNINNYLEQVKTLLDCNAPINFVVVYFVGGFEENAFVAPYDHERLALCLPIENGKSDVTLVHEITHIVHSHTAQLSAQWERTIACTILQEGLATQVSKYLVRGLSDEEYIEFTNKGWLDSCELDKDMIYKGIFPFLNDSSAEAVYQFTMGKGASNHEREAYFVGWKLVQSLLVAGLSFAEIARVQEGDIPEFVESHYHKLLRP